MRIIHRINRQEGWAVQMAGAFVFDKRVRPAGMWIVQIGLVRFLLQADEFNARFVVLRPQGRAAEAGVPRETPNVRHQVGAA